jgi:hypothetical protein
MFELHARRAQNRPHRSRRSTLFPNYFTNIALRHTQANYSRIAIRDRFHRDTGRVIDQSLRDLGDEFCHILYRVLPCRRLSCLSHHTHLRIRESRSIAHAHPIRLVFLRDLRGRAGTSETPVAVSPVFCRASALQSQTINSAIIRSLRESVCRTYARNPIRQLSLGTIPRIPKVTSNSL